MKYIISESRLEKLAIDYINDFIKDKLVNKLDNFIIISEKSDSDSWTDYMEYDKSDGRLWISRNFSDNISDFFNFTIEYSCKLIAKWFEKTFNVKVKYVDPGEIQIP